MTLEVKGLSYSYGQTKVLKDISLSIASGEFVALMGPNGSGKTTLLRCLTGYLPVKEMAILVDMRPLHTLSYREMARMFAVVPQSSSTDFPFTSRDVVTMGRIPHIASRLRGESKKDEEMVRRAFERTGAQELANRRFSELSGGERQRVIIARALAQEPKVLLLDEPTVYLDVSGQFEMMDLIRRLNREEGITIIAVLHDINMAARYSDKIALLSEGRLEAFGAPSEVLTADTIQSIYGVPVSVRKDPFTNAVYVIPRATCAYVARHGTRAHVLCGGGSGGPVMRALSDAGYSMSAGVLNVLDSDYESANDLRVPVIAEAPFSQITPEAHAENLRLIDESAVVVVAPFPVGPGNIRNLEAADHALKARKEVIVLRPRGGPIIDFVGGRADEHLKQLISSGAIPVESIDEMLKAISRRGS